MFLQNELVPNTQPKIVIHPPDGGAAFHVRSNSGKCSYSHNKTPGRAAHKLATATLAAAVIILLNGCESKMSQHNVRHKISRIDISDGKTTF